MCSDANSTTPASKVETINIHHFHEFDLSGWCLPIHGHYQKRKKGLIKDKNRLTNTKIHNTILLWYYFTQNCEATINAIVANSSETSDSWCLYQRDKSNGINVYKRKHCQSMYDMPFYQFITTLRNMKC